MAGDAVRRQNVIVFGCRGSLTTDIEADETQVMSCPIRTHTESKTQDLFPLGFPEHLPHISIEQRTSY
jgi:hypothetical protein